MPWLVTTGPAFLYALAFGLGFVLVAVGIGRRVLVALGASTRLSAVEESVLAFSLGAGSLQFVPFILGISGALSVTSLRVASITLLLVFGYDAWRVLRALRAAVSGAPSLPLWLKGWALALLPGVLLALLHALTPTLDADGLGYHLTVPKRWLVLGSLDYLPTYPYSNTPMGVEMLFTLGLAWGGDVPAKMVHLLLGLAAAGTFYVAASRVVRGALPALGVALLLFGPFGIGPLMGWAYVEAATACVLVAAGLAWLAWYRERDPSLLRIAGLLAGISASFKMTAGLVPVALAALTLALLWRDERIAQRERPRVVLSALLGFLPFVAVPVLPWLVRSAILTGNPVFPMFAGMIPSRDFTALQSKAFDQYNRYMVWGVGSGAAWGLGLRKAILGGAAAALAVVGGVVTWRQRTAAARTVSLVVLVTLLVQLGAAGLYKRYWIPVLALAELPMLLLLARWAEHRFLRAGTLAITALVSLVTAKQLLAAAEGDAAGLAKVSLGIEPQRAFIERHQPLLPLYDALNRDAAASAGVALAGYCSGFYIDRTTFCADIVQSALRVSTWEEFTADVQRLGITHVIAPRDWEAPLPELVAPAPVGVGNTSYLVRYDEQRMIGRALREHGKLLLPASDQGLYAIDLASRK
ncbi:MAG: hypothetical protein EOO73_23055 [Myxococcales bacterium]|nr:MAG: hypothetical protein EOO73_23055 [Myxococcales bacterium]